MSENPVLELTEFRVPESNVFLMTRFRKTLHHEAVSDAVAEAVRAFGLEFIRADKLNISETLLWRRIQFCMEACYFGVAIFEAIDEQDFSPNISLELGYMMGLKRHCLLLKEHNVNMLPTDLCGHEYKRFDSSNIRPTVLGEVSEWLKQVKVRKDDHDRQKVVVFVSYGGQDRCAIAKVITIHLLRQNGFTLNSRIESRAAFGPSGSAAAKTAIKVVQGKLGEDLLSAHRPRRAGVAFLFEADLILATDREVLAKILASYKSYPGTDADRELVHEEIKHKSSLLSQFFGGTDEDITDPYPDQEDAHSLQKYENCFDDLFGRISTGFSKLMAFLERDLPPKNRLRTVSFGDRYLIGTEDIYGSDPTRHSTGTG
ncbi:MAG TPA: hypothetical protein VG649_06485 [Candidatus Angelobacter sp.]|jgi:protein-tyrosine-phosphatase|nr:hypothetical protein [Candidatus Angelobacter sp.]